MSLLLTHHARRRVTARRLSSVALHAALTWGRRFWSHGDRVFRLDHRSVIHAAAHGHRIDAHEGVTVVVTAEGTVRTAWRNRAPRRIWR